MTLIFIAISAHLYRRPWLLSRPSNATAKREQEDEKSFWATLQHGTSIRLGDLSFLFYAIDPDQGQQQRELQEALQRASAGPIEPVMLLLPTPFKPTIEYHGYSLLDANLHGTTSSVYLGYDKMNGKPTAVKMVKCTWRADECGMVGLVMSPPATTGALELLASWKSLPSPAAL
jgi:hypothetical protein